MIGEEDFVMRPVLAGRLDAAHLFDGTMTLAQIALLNEALDVETENTLRIRQHERNSQRGQ